MNDKDNVKEDSPLFEAITRNESASEILTIIDCDPSAVRQRCTNGNYPLHQACLYNDRDPQCLVIMKLLDLFPQAAQEKLTWGDLEMYEYHYPLHIACRKLSDDVILKLLDIYPDASQINHTEKCIGYPLHIAFYRGRSDDVIMKLMEAYPEAASREMRGIHYDDDNKDYYNDYYYDYYDDDMFPLHYACKIGFSKRVIRKLLEIYPRALHEQASLVHWSFNSYPLDWAIRCNQSVDVIKLLVMTDPSILQQVDDDGCTPFHKACIRNRAEVVECLLQFPNLPINARTKNGCTPLHYACISDVQDLESGASLHYYPSMSYYYQEMEVAFVMMLEHPDVNVNAINDRGESVLHSIILGRKFNWIHLLLNHPCILIDRKDNKNRTPLHLIDEQIIELRKINDDNWLPRLLESQLLLQEFPTMRKWQSYEYFYQNVENWSSRKTMKMEMK